MMVMVWFALHGVVPQTVNRAAHGTVCQKECRVLSLAVFHSMTMICMFKRKCKPAPQSRGINLEIAKLDAIRDKKVSEFM